MCRHERVWSGGCAAKADWVKQAFRPAFRLHECGLQPARYLSG